MADRISREARSRNMARIRGRETGPELTLRRTLWRMGLRYRTHLRMPGRPDIAFIGDRLAIFIDGCFWHSCPEHGVAPKANSAFWRRKLKANKERDRRNELELIGLGWTFMRFWEHDVDGRPQKCAGAVLAALKKMRLRPKQTKRTAIGNGRVHRK